LLNCSRLRGGKNSELGGKFPERSQRGEGQFLGSSRGERRRRISRKKGKGTERLFTLKKLKVFQCAQDPSISYGKKKERLQTADKKKVESYGGEEVQIMALRRPRKC